jgi:hypothetical protein
LEEAISLYVADEPHKGTIKAMDRKQPRRPMEVGEMRVMVPA